MNNFNIKKKEAFYFCSKFGENFSLQISLTVLREKKNWNRFFFYLAGEITLYIILLTKLFPCTKKKKKKKKNLVCNNYKTSITL